MGKFNFDEMTQRRGTNCVKWDAESPAGPIDDDVIPLWVADMDFKVAPPIIDALRKRVEHGVFGYTHIPDSYYDSAISWWERRRGWHTEKDWYIPIDGIVPGMSIVMEALTHYETDPEGNVVEKPDNGRGPNGELPKIIIQSPAYNCFFSSVRNIGCELLRNNLIYDTEGDQATWYINFDDLEKKAADPMTKVLLFCNPHNPCGRVWPKEDLQKVADICRRNGVIIVSDEIHCELEMPGYHFTPMATIDQENTVTMNSPSKSFNIAGLEISNIITSNPSWKKQIEKVINIWEHCDLNPFGVIALQAAYNEGEPWLDALKEYLHANYRMLLDFFEARLPQFPVSKLEGTYLTWVDVSAIGKPSMEIEKSLIEYEKVWINGGTMYGRDGFVRINLACPRERLEEALRRIEKGFKRLLPE
ncbi:MAG: pyridoxal phosphate-dependent aminotransferase [Bacteroidales bacterium]|nr:pyridoxal phosphate-dependent aminotransferase [Bacteroidales bacterium]